MRKCKDTRCSYRCKVDYNRKQLEKRGIRRLLRDPLAECLNRCKDTRCSYRCRVDYNRKQLEKRGIKDPLGDCMRKCKDTRCSYRCKVNYNRQQLKKRSLSADVLENYMDGVAFGAQARRLRSCENQKKYLTYCLKAATSSFGCSAACEAAEERARTDPNHHMIGTCDESCNKKKSECYLNANGMC